jgi:intracellular multiplication protein IcmV
MKKKSKMKIGTRFSRLFDVKQWIDYDRVSAYTVYLYEGTKRLFVKQPVIAKESFDEAKNRLGLSDIDIMIRMQALRRVAILMLVFAILLICYSGYRLWAGHYLASFIGFVAMGVSLALAFRYHFWYFQFKERRLGCTFTEWYKKGLLGEKS